MTATIETLCLDPGCPDDCFERGKDRGTCAIGRKHLRPGGVCCGTCFETCDGCGGGFYVEHLFGLEDVEDPGFFDYYCHCCSLERGLPWRPLVDPLLDASALYNQPIVRRARVR